MKTKNLHYLTKGFRSTVVAAGLLIAGTAGLLFASGAQASTEPFECENSRPLIAGGGMTVGEVGWTSDGELITVTYNTYAPWCMSGVHLQLGDSVADIPQTKRHSPIPGQFLINEAFEPCSTVETFVYPDFTPTDMNDFVIVAHAVVQTSPGAHLQVPDPSVCPGGVMEHQYPGIDLESYFSAWVSEDGAYNGGDYKAWCADSIIGRGTEDHICRFYNTYDDVDDIDFIEFPETFQNINWMLNHYKVFDAYVPVLTRDVTFDIDGETYECINHVGKYSRADIQATVWYFLEGERPLKNSGGVRHPCRVEELYLQANKNGDGFKPVCGDTVGILCQPVDALCTTTLRKQPTFFEFPYNCVETAWGEGPRFNGKDWSMYIETVCE